MIRISRSLPFLVAAVFVALPAVTQQGDADREERIAALEARLEEAAQRLELTEEQRQQVEPIFEKHFRLQLGVLEEHGIDLEARAAGRDRSRLGFRKLRALQSDMEKIRKETEQKLAAILSERQMDELHRIQEEQRAESRALLRSRR